MIYSPRTQISKDIKLPRELLQLQEQFAKNSHDVWAEQRIKEGWVYGEKRDDDKKTHPCLVPFEELPESEKEYDRKTAMETLRFIIAKGYRIVKE